jgi:hypothetical protein
MEILVVAGVLGVISAVAAILAIWLALGSGKAIWRAILAIAGASGVALVFCAVSGEAEAEWLEPVTEPSFPLAMLSIRRVSSTRMLARLGIETASSLAVDCRSDNHGPVHARPLSRLQVGGCGWQASPIRRIAVLRHAAIGVNGYRSGGGSRCQTACANSHNGECDCHFPANGNVLRCPRTRSGLGNAPLGNDEN